MYLFGDTALDPDEATWADAESEAYPEEGELLYSQVAAVAPPTLIWPILPAPHSTRGQLFGAPRGKKKHEGLDMGTAGDAVRAAAPGLVTLARDTKDARGKAVILDLGGGWQVRHYHLATVTVAKGETVTAGQQIGVVGATGLPRPWPHLHFEIRQNGQLVDPLALLPARESSPVGVALVAVGLWWVLS